MVLQKRLYYGFDGYQVPAMPRGSRSVRGKGLARKKNEDNQMCAFELLATVAGSLLQEKDVSPRPCDVEAGRTQENSEKFKDKDNCNRKNGKEFKEKDSCYRKNSKWARLTLGRSSTITRETIKQEPLDEEKMFKVEPCDQGSSDESALASCVGSQRLISQDDGASIPISRLTKSNSFENFTCAEESRFDKGSNVTNSSVDSVFSEPGMLKTMPEKTYGKCGEVKCFPGYDESCEGKIEDENDTKLVSDPQRIGNTVNGTVPGVCSSDEPMELDTKTNALVSSDSSVDVPLCNEYIPCSSFPRCSDDVKKVVSRDDDENSSGCTQPSAASVKSFRPSCVGDKKITKMLDSEFWKVGPTLLNDGEISNTDMDVKPVFRSRKACYTRQRTQRCSASKRRQLFDRNLIATSDKGIAREVICNSPEKGIDVQALGSGATMHKESEPPSPVPVTKPSFKSGESHVKLSIKSFRVPEFFIEMPETATVATLKKTVLDAVTAMILGGGLRVGVHLQGKKVRDDNKTLIQTGISQDDKLDSVGFVLEPNHPPVSLRCPNVLSSSATQPITRYPTVTPLEQVVADATPSPLVSSPGSWAESDHDSVISLTDDLLLEKASPDSRALVALPTMSMGTLAVIPLHRKLRRAELVQRRIRRPFSVSEVEALVQAVEKLGTGRWRDVKLWAFDSAKHRTYVDLKDKWKTLVHTARISPQQRRGEPVPQELLDRVLQAHAYWSQQQAKQQARQQTEACLLL